MASHHFADRCGVGGAALRGPQHGSHITQVPRAEDAGGDDRERLRVELMIVVEAVDEPATDAQHLARADVGLLSVERPAQNSLQPVERLLKPSWLCAPGTLAPAATSNSKTATEPPDASPSSRNRTAIPPILISSLDLASMSILSLAATGFSGSSTDGYGSVFLETVAQLHLLLQPHRPPSLCLCEYAPTVVARRDPQKLVQLPALGALQCLTLSALTPVRAPMFKLAAPTAMSTCSLHNSHLLLGARPLYCDRRNMPTTSFYDTGVDVALSDGLAIHVAHATGAQV